MASVMRLRPSSSIRCGSMVSARPPISWKRWSRIHGTAVNCTRWVSSCRHTQSRKSVGSTSSSRSTWTTLGATRRSRPLGSWNGSNWPRTRLDMNPRRPPTSAPVIREPTAWVNAPGSPRRSVILSMTGVRRVENPSALAWIHAGRSTTRTGAVRSPASRPVKPRTYAVDRSAPSRSSATMAAASSDSTTGPDPASREPSVTASCQSTICVVMVRSLRGGPVSTRPSRLRRLIGGACSTWPRPRGALVPRAPLRVSSAPTGREAGHQVVEGIDGTLGVVGLDVVADEGEDQRPAAGVGDEPGEGARAVEGPRLGSGLATPGRVGEAVLQRAVERRDRQTGDHRAELGMAGRGRHLEDRHQGGSVKPVVTGQTAAVVDLRVAEVDAEAGQHLADSRSAAVERALAVDRDSGLPGQHLGALVVADLQYLLDDVGDGATGDPRHLTCVGRRLLLHDPAGDLYAVATEEVGELRGRDRGRVRFAAVAVGGDALVDPQGGDRGDLVVGHVARGPARAELGPREQRGVVGER